MNYDYHSSLFPEQSKMGDEDPTLCVVCKDKVADTLVIPCGHVVVCKTCSNQLKYDNLNAHKCVVCRGAIQSIEEDAVPIEIFSPPGEEKKQQPKSQPKKSKDADLNLCVNCGADIANTMVLPCGHNVACKNCSNLLKSDPVYARRCIGCNNPITEVLIDER